MVDAELKLYVGATEYGTQGNPISFPAVNAGETTPHSLNPFYLWNDKGGALGSVPAKIIEIQVLNMWIQDENMGTSNGNPSQTFTCDVTPVVDTPDPIEIIVKVGTDVWTRVGSFTGQATDAEVYTFVASTGVLTFGNGVNGKIPPNGQIIYITYMPELVSYGDEVYDNLWLEVKSLGVTTNTVSVVDEAKTSTNTTHVTVTNTTVTAVSGIWLQTDPTHVGTNYYTGGSFDANTGVLTLGTPLPGATTGVLINYSYLPIDDLESDYTPIGFEETHVFVNQIPKNNAKLLYFRLNVPATATPTGGSSVNFRIRLKYRQ